MRAAQSILILFLVLAPCAELPAQGVPYPDFELVESIPLETTLDNPGIRNTAEVWLEMINGATKSLDMEEFYFSNKMGQSLDQILLAIGRAASRGVRVRIIADARMHKTYPEPLDSIGKLGNIEVRIIDFGPLTGGVQHSKYFIVDHSTIFLGSQNFDWRALAHIHELGFRISQPRALDIYQDLFEADWALAAGRHPVPVRRYELPLRLAEAPGDTLIFSPTMSPRGWIPDSLLWDESAIVSLIDSSREELFCQVLTYSTAERGGGSYDVLDKALRRAAGRGVKVHLIVSDWSLDPNNVNALKGLARVNNIQVRYTEIPEYSKGYIAFARVEHCKYLVSDSATAWLGSCNWERGYFYSLRNAGVQLHSRKTALLLKSIFLKSWNSPYAHPIEPEGQYRSRKHGGGSD